MRCLFFGDSVSVVKLLNAIMIDSFANRLSPETACRSFAGFLVLMHCCRNLYFSAVNRGRTTWFRWISCFEQWLNWEYFSIFLGSCHQLSPVRLTGVFFARKMHSTSKFAMPVLSKYACLSGLVWSGLVCYVMFCYVMVWYVCMYVWMYVCMLCMYVCNICMYVCLSVCMYVCMCVMLCNVM